MNINRGILRKASHLVLFFVIMMLMASCSSDSLHEFGYEHPILSALIGLGLLAAFVALIVGAAALIVTYAGIAAILVLTFFLPFDFSDL